MLEVRAAMQEAATDGGSKRLGRLPPIERPELEGDPVAQGLGHAPCGEG